MDSEDDMHEAESVDDEIASRMDSDDGDASDHEFVDNDSNDLRIQAIAALTATLDAERKLIRDLMDDNVALMQELRRIMAENAEIKELFEEAIKRQNALANVVEALSNRVANNEENTKTNRLRIEKLEGQINAMKAVRKPKREDPKEDRVEQPKEEPDNSARSAASH